MGEKEIIDKMKWEVASMPQFDLKCAVCRRKFGKYFVFHHKRYISSDKIYSDFNSTLSYNKYVLPVIKSDPNRFSLLCRKHHKMVEILKSFKTDNFERLISIVRESK